MARFTTSAWYALHRKLIYKTFQWHADRTIARFVHSNDCQLSSARAIVADMREKGIWDELISRCGGGHIGDGTVCLGGKVVFTGHSLGAGLAYLVAVELLKCGADQSRLACIAFNPPGGLSSDTSSRLETHYSVRCCFFLPSFLSLSLSLACTYSPIPITA